MASAISGLAVRKLPPPAIFDGIEFGWAVTRDTTVAVVSPELISKIVVPPLAGQVGKARFMHHLIEQTTVVTRLALCSARSLQCLEVIGMRGRNGFVELRAHVEGHAVGIAESDIYSAPGQMRAWRLRIETRQRHKFSRTHYKLILIKRRMMQT